jgi:hypothetical protein
MSPHDAHQDRWEKHWRNLGLIGFALWFVSVFVVANLAFRLSDALAVIFGFGSDAYFIRGLHVSDWKHGILSNGQPVPAYLEVLRIALGFCLWAAWVFLSDPLLSGAKNWLRRRLS